MRNLKERILVMKGEGLYCNLCGKQLKATNLLNAAGHVHRPFHTEKYLFYLEHDMTVTQVRRYFNSLTKDKSWENGPYSMWELETLEAQKKNGIK